MMQDPYPIAPFTRSAAAKVSVPGSKSMTNRALILAALSNGKTRLENCLFSRDTEIMIQALIELGFEVEENQSDLAIEINGTGGLIPSDSAHIDIGNSGTSARFLTAMLAIRDGGDFTLDGDEAMRRRPISKLADTLSELGCHIETSNGYFPIRIRPHSLSGTTATVDATESSQFVSALLMAAPLAKNDLEIILSNPSIRRGYIDMTLEMMGHFGISAEHRTSTETGYRIAKSAYAAPTRTYRIEADASAASYYIGLPLVTGGVVEIEGLQSDSLQGDIAFAQIATRAGALLEWAENSLVVRFDRSASRPASLSANFYAFSDTFMTAAAIAPLAKGATRIDGIGHTRHQECDRIAAMVHGLTLAGQATRDEVASLEIAPAPLQPATIETYEDHRIAMSFAILGCANPKGDGLPWLRISDPLCCRKTFPDFFETLDSAREQSLNA
ncbi:MAG: 3-phosphoshikimate 1-carboxyvinyltransferase [Opitutales bacterium TMED158]|nr:MAG: 3-phosphoshikimate 1-carboxyvinyltransferase [Opitutales bacterium TMED158]